MSDTQYQLLFRGDVAPGQDRKLVLARLSKLFNRPAAELVPLFSGVAHVLKVAPDEASLAPFRDALIQAGAVAKIVSPVPPSNGTASHVPRAANGTSATPPAAGATPTPLRPTDAHTDTARAATAGSSRRCHTLKEFLQQTEQRDSNQGLFEFESERMLEVNLEGEVWIKTGAMVAYTGDIAFEREGLLDKGLGKLVKKSVSGEGARLTKANGIGKLYLADNGKKVTIIRLDGEPLVVNGNDILALEPSIDWDIRMMRKLSSLLAGGLFNVRLQGMGMVALTTHYDPLTLRVTHPYPVFTDPHATVAWSGSLEPSIKTDVSLKTFVGRGSGESIQLHFEGEGFVVVQPMEERSFQRA